MFAVSHITLPAGPGQYTKEAPQFVSSLFARTGPLHLTIHLHIKIELLIICNKNEKQQHGKCLSTGYT
jgi:hypothetical protein